MTIYIVHERVEELILGAFLSPERADKVRCDAEMEAAERGRHVNYDIEKLEVLT